MRLIVSCFNSVPGTSRECRGDSDSQGQPCSCLAFDRELEAKNLKKGKEFKAHLSEPVRSDAGQVIIPVGSEVKGKVEDADERHLELKFKEIKTPSGKKSIEGRIRMGRCRKCKVLMRMNSNLPANRAQRKSGVPGLRSWAWRRVALQGQLSRGLEGSCSEAGAKT